MVASAANAGADYVKFQAFKAEELAAAGAPTAGYQADNTGKTDQISLLKGLELEREEFAAIGDCCRSNAIGFMVSAFDTDYIDDFVLMGQDRIKIPSGEITNRPMLEDVANFGLPVLLSTGMSTLQEVEDAVTALNTSGAKDITLLHCTSLYPAPMDTLNLLAIKTMAEHFSLSVGFSDHSLGGHATIAAVALGATVIEKHFTLNRTLPGPDHRASVEPDELAEMITHIRDISVALGDGEKRPMPGELETSQKVRRSWHASRDLAAGTVLTDEDMVLKRPADGITPAVSLVGRRLLQSVVVEEPIREVDIDAADSCA